MSFDIFFLCFDRGAPAQVPFALIEKGFGSFAARRDDTCWSLEYPDGGFTELFVDATQDEVGDFMVSRPPLSPQFWQALFDLLQQTKSCLLWPGDAPLVANAAARAHLPIDIAELGEPIVVSTPEQILDEIRKS
jgi:hypothetical protein